MNFVKFLRTPFFHGIPLVAASVDILVKTGNQLHERVQFYYAQMLAGTSLKTNSNKITF